MHFQPGVPLRSICKGKGKGEGKGERTGVRRLASERLHPNPNTQQKYTRPDAFVCTSMCCEKEMPIQICSNSSYNQHTHDQKHPFFFVCVCIRIIYVYIWRDIRKFDKCTPQQGLCGQWIWRRVHDPQRRFTPMIQSAEFGKSDECSVDAV